MTHPFDRRSVLRSVLMVTGSTYVTYIFGLVTSTLIARSLGPADFGRYSYLVWLSGVLIMLSTNGLTTSGMRFISESIGRGNEAAARDINGWLLRRHYVSLILVAGGFAEGCVHALTNVDHTQAVRPEQPHTCLTRGLVHALLAQPARLAQFAETRTEDDGCLAAAPTAVDDRILDPRRRHRDDRQTDRCADSRDGSIGSQALDLRPRRIDRIDRAVVLRQPAVAQVG